MASLVLLADRRAGRRSGWLPWTALAAGTAGSLAANIATAHPDPASRIIAGWPALALLLAVKLLSGLLEGRTAPDAHVPVDHTPQASTPIAPATPTSATTAHDADEPPADARPAKIWSNRTAPREQQPSPSPAPADPTPDSHTIALLPAARTARDALHHDGQTLTQDTLAARFRQHGHPIRNS